MKNHLLKLKIAFIFLVVFFGAFFFVNISHAAWSDVNIWLDNWGKKYRLNGEDGTSGANSLTIKMAKNEFEPFQILTYNAGSDSQIINDVTVTQTSGPGTISDIYIYRMLYIQVTTPSRHDYQTGWYPDPLVPKVDRYFKESRNGPGGWPASGIPILASQVQGFWVDIGTSADTPAGTYTFNIVVTKSGEASKTATLTLQVWNFTLPSTPTLKSFMDIGTGLLDDGFYGGAYQGEAWWKNMEKLHMKALLYHRLGTNTNNNGGWFTEVDANGFVTSGSWKSWDTQYASLLDGTEISSGPLAGAKMPAATVELGNSVSDARFGTKTKTINYFQSWWDHFTAKGWDPMNRLYVYAWDEPAGRPMSFYNFTFRGSSTVTDQQAVLTKAQEMNLINTGGAGIWKNTFTTAPNSSSLSSPLPAPGEPGSPYTSLDTSGFYIPVTALYTYRYPWGTIANKWARSVYPGYENWATRNHGGYLANFGSHNNTCPPNSVGVYCTDNAPDIMLETPPVLTRGYFWLQWFYRVHMFLYSDVVHFYNKNHAPYADLMSVFGGNGDEDLFYPGVTSTSGRNLPVSTPSIGGTNDIPIESIRLKLLREDIEDREYMEILRNTAALSFADSQVNSIFNSLTDPGPYYAIKTNANVLTMARENMANQILGLPPSDTTPPAAPTGVTVN